MLWKRTRLLWQKACCWLETASPKLLSVYLILVCLAFFWYRPKEVIGGDSPGIAYLPASIIRHHTLKLDPYVNQDPLFDLSRGPHWVVEGRDGYYSKFSPVPSLLAVPVYAVSFLVQGVPMEGTGNLIMDYFTLSRYVALLLMTATVVTMFNVFRSMVSQFRSLGLSLLYAFATYTWHTASSTLASQSSGELFLALALLFLIKSQQNDIRSDKHLLIAGLCMGVAVAARLQLVIFALLVAVYVLYASRLKISRWGWFFAGATPVAILLALYNTWAFGAPWLTGYGTEASAGWSNPLWQGLMGILFSPSHGLWVYSPIVFLGIVLGVVCLATWKTTKNRVPMDRTLFIVIIIGALLHLLLMSTWWWWFGGAAYNQRMLAEVQPLLFVIIAVGYKIFVDKAWYTWAVGLTGGIGFLVNVMSLTFQNQHLDVIEKHRPELIWSFSDMEVLFYLRQHGVLNFLSQLLAGLGSLLLLWIAITMVFGLLGYLYHGREKKAM